MLFQQEKILGFGILDLFSRLNSGATAVLGFAQVEQVAWATHGDAARTDQFRF